MKRGTAWISGLALMSVAFSSQAGEDKARLKRLAAGEIIVEMADVKGMDVPEARVEAVIDAPPAKVWKVISDCAAYKKTMPRVLKSKLHSYKDGVQVCEVMVDAPFPVPNLNGVTRVKLEVGPPQWRRSWTLIRGDYKSNVGSWRLKAFGPDGKRTHVWYQVIVEPDIPIPGFIQSFAQESSLPDMIEHVRKAVAWLKE